MPDQPDSSGPLDVQNPDILRCIGRVTTHWAYVEALIEDMIAGFLGTSPSFVYTVTGNLNMNNRLNALRALTQLRLPDSLAAELSEITKRLHDLVPLRNKVVHGLWGQLPEDPNIALVTLTKSARKLRIQPEYMNTFYLEWLDDQAAETSFKLHKLGVQIGVIDDA